MTNEAVFFLIIAWIVGVFVNAGFVYAWWMAKFPPDKEEDQRAHLAFSIGFSIIPFFWVVSLFTTSFYYHGWLLPGSASPEPSHDQ